jgi:hypothetical protein
MVRSLMQWLVSWLQLRCPECRRYDWSVEIRDFESGSCLCCQDCADGHAWDEFWETVNTRSGNHADGHGSQVGR